MKACKKLLYKNVEIIYFNKWRNANWFVHVETSLTFDLHYLIVLYKMR